MAAGSGPRIALVGTGGTISLRARDALDLYEYGEHGTLLSAQELLATLPPVDDVPPLEIHEAAPLLSTAADPDTWADLVARIEAICADPDVAGVVLTHGTATLDEAAYFLHLTVTVDVPVVVVAAMRPSNVVGTDAQANLLDAIRVADAPVSGPGVVVVANGVIHHPRELSKSSVHRIDALASRSFGPLGHVEPDGSVRYERASRRERADTAPWRLPPPEGFPRVDLALSYAGSDGTAIDAFVAAGAAAVVVAGLAPGRTTPGETAALERALAAGVRIVQSSRAGSGRVLQRGWTRQRGIVVADDLLPQKARILAQLALTCDPTIDELQDLFARF